LWLFLSITVTLEFGILGNIFALKNSNSLSINTDYRRGIILVGDTWLEQVTSAV
jgi:hypothetical protein